MTAINPVSVEVQAGELSISKQEIIGPNKLRMLADQGWSVSSAWNNPGQGFTLLLQRQIGEYAPPAKVDVIIHKGTTRCPEYCNCTVGDNRVTV